MTFGQIVELIHKRLYGGQTTPDQLITPQQVAFHVLTIRDQLAWEMLIKVGDEQIDAAFLTTYENLPVSLDSAQDIYYMILPAQPMSHPRGKGIFSIRPMQGLNRHNQTIYVPVPVGYWELGTLWLEGNIAYQYVGENRVNFPNMRPGQDIPVLVQMVQSKPLNEQDWDLPMDMPTYMEAEVIQRVMQLLGVREFDSVNDK
jgi:hypothetical protein